MNWQIIPEFPISVTFIVNFAMFYLDRMNIEAAEPRCLLIGCGWPVIGRHKLTNSSLEPARPPLTLLPLLTLEGDLMSLNLIHVSITDYSSSSSLRLPKK